MAFDFHKVAEDEDFEVYQAMKSLKTTEMVQEDGTVLAPPKKYAPHVLKVTAENVQEVFEHFAGANIDYVQVGSSGITVRVKRTSPFEPKEDGIERFKPKGG